MLDPKTWLAAAQALPLDGQRRMRHDCGEGTPLVVYHKDDGWSAYCHRCGMPGFAPRPVESLSERLARVAARQKVEANVSRSIVPPQPMVTDVTLWPASARVWLYKAGLSNDDISKLGIYYHETTDRVVIPIVDDGVLIYWQARAYDWVPSSTRPKYLNPTAVSRGGGVLFRGLRPAGPTVLVEDYLSAYKVSSAGFNCLSLLGTSLTDACLRRVLDTDAGVMVWMDNDVGRRNNPGQIAAKEICQTLRGLGVPVENVVSMKDPKLHSRKEIQLLLV